MPQQYRVIIQPRASRDLAAICAYIEQTSPKNAVAMAQRLLFAIESLQHLPHRCKVYRSHRDKALIIHSMSIRPFILYYRVSDPTQLVDVIAIVHGARQQPPRLES